MSLPKKIYRNIPIGTGKTNERTKERTGRAKVYVISLSPGLPSLSLSLSPPTTNRRGTKAMTTRMMMWGATPPPLILLILSSNCALLPGHYEAAQERRGGGSLAVAGERACEGLLFFALFCPLSTINGHKAPFLPSSVVEGGRTDGRPLILMDLSVGGSVGRSRAWL